MITPRKFTFLALATASAALAGCVVTEKTPRVTTVETYEPGYVTTSLPTGYTTTTYRGSEYYVVGDTYYQREPNGYRVVRTPGRTANVSTYRSGYVVNTLPSGYVTRHYRGNDYYVANNTWYRPHQRGYVVVDAPL